MNNIERLQRIDVLLGKIMKEPILANDKSFDRISHHIELLNEDYKDESKVSLISDEELNLIIKIMQQYQTIKDDISSYKDQMAFDRKTENSKISKIQNGYFQKSIAFQSKHINNYK